MVLALICTIESYGDFLFNIDAWQCSLMVSGIGTVIASKEITDWEGS